MISIRRLLWLWMMQAHAKNMFWNGWDKSKLICTDRGPWRDRGKTVEKLFFSVEKLNCNYRGKTKLCRGPKPAQNHQLFDTFFLLARALSNFEVLRWNNINHCFRYCREWMLLGSIGTCRGRGSLIWLGKCKQSCHKEFYILVENQS